VNREHLLAFLWLRWRLRVNQFRRAGTANAVFFFIFVVLAGFAAVGLLGAGFLVGFLALPHAPPAVRLLVWDGVIATFLFFWITGLFADLKRAEGLAIDKVLHLPVSPSGVFLLNYLSSLFSLTLLAFLPGMIGLIVGEVCAGSLLMLLALPLLAAFVLAITAITYQFQGWLASLMTNPRRRRTVIVIATAVFVLLAQLPNMVNMARPWQGGKPDEEVTRWNEQRTAAQVDLHTKKLTPQEYAEREKALQKEFNERQKERLQRGLDRAGQTARLISLVLPPGWLAVGISDLAGGGVVPALLGTLGLGLIGAVSLWRAYRTTIRIYTGEFSGQGRQAAPRQVVPVDPNRVQLLERRIPWVSEYASAVAFAAWRSLSRAPEAKMAMLAPIIMLVIFGGMSISSGANPPAEFRPVMALGSGIMALFFGGMQLLGNQFGYDRAGFRAYVLSPVPRREILLGKNLALAPLALGLGTVILLLVGAVYPMRIDYYPAALLLLVAAYLVFCLLANAMSILAPIPMAAGSLQPSSVKVIPVLIQMAFLLVFPFVMAPLVFPLGVEFLLAEFAGVHGLPISLPLSLLVLVMVVFVYRKVLTWEGNWLATSEQSVLETVTSKEE